MRLQVPAAARLVVLRLEAGMVMTAATAILATPGAAPEQTMELLMVKLLTLAMAGTREPLMPLLLEALGEPKLLSQLLRARGERISYLVITKLLRRILFFLNNLRVITRANGQY